MALKRVYLLLVNYIKAAFCFSLCLYSSFQNVFLMFACNPENGLNNRNGVLNNCRERERGEREERERERRVCVCGVCVVCGCVVCESVCGVCVCVCVCV